VSSDELGATGILKRRAPVWWWLRKNFTLPVVLTIAGVVLAAGKGYLDGRADLRDLKRRDPGPQLERIAHQVDQVLQSQAAMKQQLVDFNRRVAAQEDEWKIVHQAAAQRVPRGRPVR
jgi:hypothetical protein